MRQPSEIHAEITRLQDRLTELNKELEETAQRKRRLAIQNIEYVLSGYDPSNYNALFELKVHYDQDISEERFDAISIAEDKVIISLALPFYA